MKLIYNNFDALDITFQGAFPKKILEQLEEAKTQAQNEKNDVLIRIGSDELPVMVAETGMSGGYRYRFDTGLDGEIWAIAHSTNSKLYNIRVSVKSLALALSGYEAVKQRLIERLISFEAIGASAYEHEISGKTERLFLPMERISRFDYCFDFIMESAFEPLSKRFVAHQRTKKHVYGERMLKEYSASNGEKTNTIRLGTMPSREVTIYNKTKEIVDHNKPYWWDIWGLDKDIFKESGNQIWRIEVRAGKDELDKWPLKRFDEFNDKAGDVIVHILKAIRYTEPNNDSNRSRWPNAIIWDSSISTAYKALAPYRSNAIRENVIRDYRENVINGYSDRIFGNLIGLTAAQGRDISELTIVLDELQEAIAAIVKQNPNEAIAKHKKAKERFSFLV